LEFFRFGFIFLRQQAVLRFVRFGFAAIFTAGLAATTAF
jgi:hypothetical protein